MNYFEDVYVGYEIPRLRKGPISPMHIFRWSAASENFHRIHYDLPFAMEHEKLPNIVINGSWKQNVLFQVINDWLADNGWLWKAAFQFRGMNVPGETLYGWGRVKRVVDLGEFGAAELDIGLVNQDETESTPGHACVILQKRSGPSVPYPFDPKLVTGYRPEFESS